MGIDDCGIGMGLQQGLGNLTPLVELKSPVWDATIFMPGSRL